MNVLITYIAVSASWGHQGQENGTRVERAMTAKGFSFGALSYGDRPCSITVADKHGAYTTESDMGRSEVGI